MAHIAFHAQKIIQAEPGCCSKRLIINRDDGADAHESGLAENTTPGPSTASFNFRAIEGLELPIPALAVQQFIVAEDAKTRLALQGAPWEQEVLAQANAILLALVGDERLQAANECE